MSSIEANGNVIIRQADMMGKSGAAVYDVREGKIVLSLKPRVKRLDDELSGEIITFYRGTGRMVCEPNAVLKLRVIPGMKDGGLKRNKHG